MQLDPNFCELFTAFDARDVRYVVVGGYALAVHGHPRYTGDLDLWVEPTQANAQRVVDALDDFGFSGLGLTADDFVRREHVIQLGRPPLRVDLMTDIDGVEFTEVYEARVDVDLEGLTVPFISLEHLRRNKAASGRPRDLADLADLDDDG